MSSDAGGRLEVKGMTGHPPAVCSRVWPRQWEKNDDRRLTSGMVERAVVPSEPMVRPPLFRDQISNCTNLFRPEPNGPRHKIFAFVSLLFSNL